MSTVTEAQAAIAQGERDLKLAKIAEAKRQLAEVREVGRATKRELDKALKELERGELEVLRAKAELAKINAALDACVEPDVLDFPSEREMADVRVEQARLRELRRQAVQELRESDHATAEPRMRSIDLDSRLVNLRYAARHLEDVIESREGTWAKGSVGPA
jgi:chromosome segregation ATPase